MEPLADAALRCLLAREPAEKLQATRQAAGAWRRGALRLVRARHRGHPIRPGLPSALSLVAPHRVPRRRLGSPGGLGALLHAVAHIEFNAINLAWDCVWRFGSLPRAFYDDWIRVAVEEAGHFEMLAGRLAELGISYGELPAHDGLWEMAEKTSDSLASRMAMVPRVLEARGLDVTPAMIERVRGAGDERAAAILEVILAEEVGHVAVGSRWFRHACRLEGRRPDDAFAEIVQRYLGRVPRGPFSLEHRRRAGFSKAELEFLTGAAASQA